MASRPFTDSSNPTKARCIRPVRLLQILVAAFGLAAPGAWAAEVDAPHGLETRVQWTTSRVLGSPEPPLPYAVEPVFKSVAWKSPLYVSAEPGTQNLIVVQQGGEKDRPSRLLRLVDTPESSATEPFLEIPRRLVYGLTFHPGYTNNGFVYVFNNGTTGENERTNRISRFTVDRTQPYRCDPASEQVIIEWRSAGHDGGDLAFGRDGTLFISAGDGTSDSDGWDSGQTVNDLLGGVLRIDVDHPDAGRFYSVPKDNPFVSMKDARPELWAYGLRNPWRLTVDRKTGHLWVGNNGQDLWETAHFVRPGENYGWSVYEGSHPFYLNRRRGPTPIVAPTIEHHHSEARSLTGGVVYYGDDLPALNGAYIYGDYSTGRIWGARHDGQKLTWHQELAGSTLQIAGFGVSHRGQLLIVDLAGGLFRLVPAPKRTPTAPFPNRLSDTGLFRSVKDGTPEPGVISYSVNAPGWTDGAVATRHLAVPGDKTVGYSANRGWNFPDGTVLVQTLALGSSSENPRQGLRIETRILTRQEGQWAGYSYRWNDSQTDATLVPANGSEATFAITDSQATGGRRSQNWHFPGRSECLACHSRAVNFVLGMSEAQMNRDHVYDSGVRDNQIRALTHIGMFKDPPSKPASELTRLFDPYAAGGDLEQRARSYLHANCSVCHVEAGGGNARMLLEITTAREAMNLFGARPQHDTFGIPNAMLVAPGDPARSVLLHRLSRRGRGQMPPLVTGVVDERAVNLFREWIQSMPPEHPIVREWNLVELESALPDARSGRSFEPGKAAFKDAGCVQCHRFAGDGGSVGPDLTGIAGRRQPREILESILLPSKVIAPEYASTEVEIRGGEKFVGRIEREDPRELVMRPAAAEDPVTIEKSKILRRGFSPVSNMPAGILNTLTREQILDLLAYLLSDGNEKHAAFAPK